MNNEQILKDALKKIIIVGEKVSDSLEDDGRISWAEGIGIGISAIGLFSVFKNGKETLEAFKNVTPEEKANIIVWFEEEFDIENDFIEVIIEKAFAAILSFGELLELLEKRPV